MSKQRRPKPNRGSRKSPPLRSTSSVTWRELWLAGVTALLVATPMIPSESSSEAGASVVLTIGWLVLLFGWSLSVAVEPRPTVRWGATMTGMVLLIMSQFVSGVAMAWQGQPRSVVNTVWQWLAFGVAFFLVRQVFRSQRECRALVAVMMSMAVCISIHGYEQYAVSMPRTRLVFEKDPAAAMASAGFTAAEGSPEYELFRSRLYSTEPFATFRLANSLAGFLAPWLVLALAIGTAVAVARAPSDRLTLVAAGVTALLIAGCWLLTKSRSAWIAVAVGCGLAMLFGRARGWRLDRRLVAWIGGALALLVAILTLVGGLDWLILTESQKSLSYRLQYWLATVGMIRDYPWLGCGPGNFQQFYTAHKVPGASETVADPHNFVLEVWATSGTFGFLALVALILLFIGQVGRPPAEDSIAVPQPAGSESQRGSFCILGGGLLGILIAYPSGLFVGFIPDLTVLLWGLPAAAIVLGLWFRWIRDGSLASTIVVCAAATLLVNLTAAGGISYAGVAMSLWTLAAIALNLSETSARGRHLSRKAAFGLMLGSLLLTGLMYFTAYRPVLHAKEMMAAGQLARQQSRLRDAEAAFLAAASRDQLAALPWFSVAETRHQLWLGTRSPTDRARFEQAVQALVDRNRRSYVVRQQVADWWLASYRATSDDAYLDLAADWYRQMLRFYPSYNRGHARLAWVLHLADRQSEAADAASRAWELDQANPHREQKLRHYVIPDPGPPPGAAQPPGPQGLSAELWMQWLRTQ